MPHAVHLVVGMGLQVGRNSQPVENLIGEFPVRVSLQSASQSLDGIISPCPAKIDVGFTDVEHGQKFPRREKVDAPVVDGTPAIGEQQRRRPDDIQRAHDVARALEKIQLEQDETFGEFPLNGGV